MGSKRNKREEGDGEQQGGAQDLSSSHMELSEGTEPRRKMEAAALPPSPPPPSPPLPPTRAASPSLHLATCCKDFPMATSGH